MVILQCCAPPLEQAAEHTPKYKRHCIFSTAAKIMFVFNSLVTHQPPHPPPHPTPLLLSAFFFPQSPSCIHFSIMFTKCNKHVAVYMGPNCATRKWTLTLTLRCDKVVQSVTEVRYRAARTLWLKGGLRYTHCWWQMGMSSPRGKMIGTLLGMWSSTASLTPAWLTACSMASTIWKHKPLSHWTALFCLLSFPLFLLL